MYIKAHGPINGVVHKFLTSGDYTHKLTETKPNKHSQENKTCLGVFLIVFIKGEFCGKLFFATDLENYGRRR
jgi:hypothetical protein